MQKVLVLVFLAASVASGHYGGHHGDPFASWALNKAYESCWGEDVVKAYTVSSKKAVAVCSQQDAPELDLPPFRSTYRFINTLLTNAGQIENMRLAMALKIVDEMNRGNAMPYNNNNKYTMKEMFRPKPSAYSNNHRNNLWGNSFGNHNNNPWDTRKAVSDYMGYGDKSSDDILEEILKEKLFEQKIRSSMMSYKQAVSEDKSLMEEMMEGVGSDRSTNRQRLIASALLNSRRYKRQAGGASKPLVVAGAGVAATTLPESLDLGDRLAEKLKAEQDGVNAMVGNFTCVLREMRVLNANNEIDVALQKATMDEYGVTDGWLKSRVVRGMEACAAMAASLPEEVLAEYDFSGPGGTPINVGRVKHYLRCLKKTKLKACVYKDTKDKLENNFGSLEKILEQTQLTEDQLFPLVIMLLEGGNRDDDRTDYYF